MVDRWLGRFLNRMDELGLFENTLFLLISDHGVGLAEHGATGKPAYALWPEITDIVFLIRHPDGTGAGETSDYYASTHDVAPTILSALGIAHPEGMEGQNLLPILDGNKPEEERPYFTTAYDNYVWARDDKYAMFSENTFKDPKLYDLVNDPLMNNNVYGAQPKVARHMFDDYITKDAGGPLPNYDV
jgi:arylsulfatase A-like enzyme